MKLIKTLFILIAFAFTASIGSSEEWKITSLDWEPFSSSTMSTQGRIIQKLRNILKQNGIELVVEFYPWKRSQHLANEEGYVGYFPAWPEEVNTTYFFPSVPIGHSEIAIMKRSDADIKFTTVDDLFKQGKVGIVSTYVYPEEISSAAKKYPAHLDATPDERSLVIKLSKGRFAVAITDPDVMLYAAQQEGIGNVEKLVKLMEKPLVIAFQKNDANRVNAKKLEAFMKNQKM